MTDGKKKVTYRDKKNIDRQRIKKIRFGDLVSVHSKSKSESMMKKIYRFIFWGDGKENI